MTIQQFINKAVEGGWKPIPPLLFSSIEYTYHIGLDCIFTDPKAWQAVGKVENWGRDVGVDCKNPIDEKGEHCDDYDCNDIYYKIGWQCRMQGMVNDLIEGKTIEEFLSIL